MISRSPNCVSYSAIPHPLSVSGRADNDRAWCSRTVRTVTAKNVEVQSFIRNLMVGDQVDMVYEEALAISIEPTRA
jgi:hypothetical protein